MLCPECGKRPATFHYTKIINGHKTEFHLCERCAQQNGEPMPVLESGFSFHQLLSGLLNIEIPTQDAENASVDARAEGLRCPTCGLTYHQFSKVGRFGCEDCYAAFSERLMPLFRRVHGHTVHRGKIPERAKGELRLIREIEKLKEELAVKVREEKFEEAAKLRDRIRTAAEKFNKE